MVSSVENICKLYLFKVLMNFDIPIPFLERNEYILELLYIVSL